MQNKLEWFCKSFWLYFKNTETLEIHSFLEEMLAKKTSVVCVECSFARCRVLLLLWHSVLCCRVWLAGYAVFFCKIISIEWTKWSLRTQKFAGSGKSPRSVHLFIVTPAASSRLLAQLSWLEVLDPPQQFFPKKSPVKPLAFWLNVKEAGKIQTS